MKAKNKLFAICIALLTITLVHDTVNAQKTAPGPGYFSRVFLTDDDLGDPFDGRAIDLYYNPTTYNFEIKGLNGLNSYGPHLTMNLTSGNIGIAQDPDNNCKFRINATTSNDWGLIVDHSSKTGFKHAIRANVDHKNTKGLSVGYVEGSKSTVENFYVYGSGNLNTQGTIIAKGDISSDQNIIGNGLYGKFFVIEDNFRGTFDGEYFSTTGTLRLNTNCNSNVFITGDTGRVGIGASNVDRAKLFVKSPSFYQTGIVDFP